MCRISFTYSLSVWRRWSVFARRSVHRLEDHRHRQPQPCLSHCGVLVVLPHSVELLRDFQLHRDIQVCLWKMRRCSGFLCSIANRTIHWPSLAKMNDTEARFQEMSNFPDVLGVLGGCLIQILAPMNVSKII